MKVFITLVGLILLLILAILIGAQNDQLVTVNYLVAQSSVKLSVLMAIMMVIGIAFSVVAFSLFWVRVKWRISMLERKQKHLNTVKND